MASGLESIALAVAHLERIQSGGEETEVPPRQVRQHPHSPSSNVSEKETDYGKPPASYHPQYSSMPRSAPFSQQTRLVSMDTASPKERSPSHHHYAENPVSQHLTSHHHFEGMMASPQFRHYEHHMHSPPVRHDEFIYQAMAVRQQGQHSYNMMMQTHPLSQRPQHRQEPPPPPLHHIQSPTHHHHKSHLMQESPGAKLAQSSQVSPVPSQQQQKHLQAPVPPSSSNGQLPAALLAITDSVEGFFTMEMDPSAYPPVPKPSEVIVQVQRNDVLLGRGGETNHHIGNIQYRQLVKLCQPAYLEAKRRDKPKIAERIVFAVRCLAGRFLKKDADTGTWRDVGNTRAREKTSQALREGAPELRNGAPPSPTKKNHNDINVPPPPPPPRNMSRHQAGTTNSAAMTAENYHAIMHDRIMQERANMIVHNHPCLPPTTEVDLRAGVGGFGGLVAKPSVTVEPSPNANPKKKRRTAEPTGNETYSAKKKELPTPQVQVPVSPTVSVPTTVSGDDEEVASTSSAKQTNFGNVCSETSSPKVSRALPRIKLLKRRLEQNA